jgi:hypothetical protein
MSIHTSSTSGVGGRGRVRTLGTALGTTLGTTLRTWATFALGVVGAAGCGGNAAPPSEADLEIGNRIASALVDACPMAAASDEAARAQCAAKLSDNKYLADVMKNPIMWGGQKVGTSYHPEESNMNWFNTYVWRRMYLSLMMFPGGNTTEQTADGLTVVHMPVQFRNELDMGSYPYPFWHSASKWSSYQLARELVVVIKDGKWIGAMRSADQDQSRAQVAHTWSGQWQWQVGGVEMPYVSLYTYLLSPSNPSTERLDSAYRALSDGLRNQSCMMCHSPDNYAGITPLEFFNYPNQALAARNSIIARLQGNNMPPANDLGLPVGIASDTDRQELIALAQEFKAAGDAALAYEGEPALNPADDPTMAATMPAAPTGIQ